MTKQYKKNTVFLGLAAILVGFGLLWPTSLLLKRNHTPDTLNERPSESVVGVYDRNQPLTAAPITTIRHVVLDWTSPEDAVYRDSLLAVISKNPSVLLTIVTQPEAARARSKGVLNAVLNGDYDEKLKELCALLSPHQNGVFLRWSPEMEVPVDHYPWQKQAPDTYIRAFRHVAQVCKRHAPGIKIVWGPAGYPGDLEYWPGSDTVDYISVTMESESERLSSAYPKEESIVSLVKHKLHRLRFVDKPILLLDSPAGTLDQQSLKLAFDAMRKDSSIVYDTSQASDPVDAREWKRDRSVVIGVYDPQERLVREKPVSVEHVFTDWGQIQDGRFRKAVEEVVARQHDIIVTMEPWGEKNHPSDRQVLTNIVQGLYDDPIRTLYEILSKVDGTVYLRWAHEMDIPIDRYPWQSQDPVDYIRAFRYFMNFDRHRLKNIRTVWGPAGDRSCLDWWPGGDVVDYISLAIYGLPDKNITDPSKQESFDTIFNRKYYRLRFVNKPIFITEFGVKGTKSYQQKWLKSAATTIANHPIIAGVCYFNMYDNPKVWGEIETPDWSISKETFEEFVEAVLANRSEPDTAVQNK